MKDQQPAKTWNATVIARSSKWRLHASVWGVLLFSFLIMGAVVWVNAVNWGPHEATSSEARAALGMLKDRARVVYERTGKVPRDFAELGVREHELLGTYYKPANYIIVGGTPECWSAVCTGVYESQPKHLIVTADLVSGKASFNR